MVDILCYPLALLATSLSACLVARRAVRPNRCYPLDDQMRHEFNLPRGAALTRPGLIVPVGFSMAPGGRDEIIRTIPETPMSLAGSLPLS